MSAVVRVLWGEERPDSRWIKARRDVWHASRRRESCPFHIYVYGKDNVELLTKMGFSGRRIHLVHDDPYPDGKCDEVIGVDNKGKNLFRHPWHYKHQLILKAIENHGPVIYCDWDLTIVCRDPSDAFGLLGDRRFAFMSYKYRRPQRTLVARDADTSRIRPSGAWLYCRDSYIPDMVLEGMVRKDHHLSWHDEEILNDLIDTWHNGWPGDEVWLRTYESPVVVCGRNPWITPGQPWQIVGKDPSGQYKAVRLDTPIPFTWYGMFSHFYSI